MRLGHLFGLSASLLAFAACSGRTVQESSSGGTSSACQAGTERCACYGNSTCNSGLECHSDLCVAMATGGSASNGGTPVSAGRSRQWWCKRCRHRRSRRTGWRRGYRRNRRSAEVSRGWVATCLLAGSRRTGGAPIATGGKIHSPAVALASGAAASVSRWPVQDCRLWRAQQARVQRIRMRAPNARALASSSSRPRSTSSS